MQARDVRPFAGREVFFRMRNGARRHGVVERILDRRVICTAGRRRRRFVIDLDDITWMVQCLTPHETDDSGDADIPPEPIARVEIAALRAARLRALPAWRRALRRLTLP